MVPGVGGSNPLSHPIPNAARAGGLGAGLGANPQRTCCFLWGSRGSLSLSNGRPAGAQALRCRLAWLARSTLPRSATATDCARDFPLATLLETRICPGCGAPGLRPYPTYHRVSAEARPAAHPEERGVQLALSAQVATCLDLWVCDGCGSGVLNAW